MDNQAMLEHLEELAKRIGIRVRYESAAGRVGLCVLRGERVAVIDSNLRVPDRVAALASVLAGEELNGVYVAPAVRKLLDRSKPLRVRPGEPWGEMQGCDTPGADDSEPEAAASVPEKPVHEAGANPQADAD